MAEHTYINGNLDTLKTVLENSGYFTTVTKEAGGSIGYLVCTKGSLEFKLGDSFSSNPSGVWCVSVSGAAASCSRSVQSGAGNAQDYKPLDAYVCSGGVAVVCKAGRIAICKNNNNETVVIFGEGKSGANSNIDTSMSKICAIAESDTAEHKYLKNNVDSDLSTRRHGQTYLIPIPTDAANGTVSYSKLQELVMDKEVWHAAVHGVSKSWTGLSD